VFPLPDSQYFIWQTIMLALEILYLFSVVLLAVYGLNSLILTWLYRQHQGETSRGQMGIPVDAGTSFPHPHVTVQLPVYNERHVVERLIEAAISMDWPARRLQIQVLDDSTDDTRQIIAAALERYRARGVSIEIEHVRRPDRRGFKAGALQHGLASARGEFVAIFDADFTRQSRYLSTYQGPVAGHRRSFCG
jgi:cellulose synthase/poly-beta-1,6-N-acetylglucosamine synthase-like glycosyltransferase